MRPWRYQSKITAATGNPGIVAQAAILSAFSGRTWARAPLALGRYSDFPITQGYVVRNHAIVPAIPGSRRTASELYVDAAQVAGLVQEVA